VLLNKDPGRIGAMFDAIAGRYDALNRLLSAGLDRRWRRQAIDALGLTGSETLLDLCTGTADVAIAALAGKSGRARRVVGVDVAAAMLRIGLDKVRSRRVLATLVRGDAARLPLLDSSIDAAIVAFGIRNVDQPAVVCQEVLRVLRPGARFVVLEFGVPTIPGLRAVYMWYFRRILPRIGKVVSGHSDAYSYLPASVGEFPSPDRFMVLLRGCGFGDVEVVPLTFGVVSMYRATTPARVRDTAVESRPDAIIG
jgi:demethylmenaquinone methyltransferase/2-methoxy-6-polyprenyl-1,4-benzoquinol methylase